MSLGLLIAWPALIASWCGALIFCLTGAVHSFLADVMALSRKASSCWARKWRICFVWNCLTARCKLLGRMLLCTGELVVWLWIAGVGGFGSGLLLQANDKAS